MLARPDIRPDFFVYVIAISDEQGIAGPVKVGSTQCPDARLSSLQTGNASELRIACLFRFPDREMAGLFERSFHETMSPARLKGEWFDLTPTEAMLAMCENIEWAAARICPTAINDRTAVLFYTGVWHARRKVLSERYTAAWEDQAWQ